MAKLTVKDLKAQLKAIGIEHKKTEYGEHRINYIGGKEKTASYHTDIDDALGTGKAMAAHKAKKQKVTANFQVTAADKSEFIASAKRLLQSVASMAIKINPKVSTRIEFNQPRVDINAPGGMGILDFAKTATDTQLVAAIEQLELAKYKLTEQGDYFNAWRYGHRQRILLGVLSGMTVFKLNRI